MTDIRKLFHHSYDFVFGLGQNCANASYMTDWNLRTCSSPFDWLDGRQAGLSVCVDLICNDFRGFLAQESLEPFKKTPENAPDDPLCDYYYDKGTGFRVIHDFPCGVALEDYYSKVMTKYQRRINRLYSKASEARRTLFTYWSRFESIPDDQLMNLANRLREKFSGSTIDLLVIEHNDDITGIDRAEELADGVYRVVGHFFVERPDSQVKGDEKLCGQVYGAIPRAWALRCICWKRQMKISAIRLLTSFCPGKTRRKDIRKRLIAKYVRKSLA